MGNHAKRVEAALWHPTTHQDLDSGSFGYCRGTYLAGAWCCSLTLGDANVFEQWVSDLLSLSDRLESTKVQTAAYAGLEATAPDARLLALSGMQQAVLACAFWVNAYAGMCAGPDGEAGILRYAGSNLPLKTTVNLMLTQVRLSLAVQFHFKVEGLLATLLDAISNRRPQGILRVFKELSDAIGLPNYENKVPAIRAFSSIRNSLHNNGVHVKDSFSVQVGGHHYAFVQGEPVRCASLGDIISLLSDLTTIINEVLFSARAKQIARMIPDPFVRWLHDDDT